MVRDDGSYDVLDERGYRADDLCLAFLGDLVARHPHLADCADLADGQVAVAAEHQGWSRDALSRRDRRDSAQSWQHAGPIQVATEDQDE